MSLDALISGLAYACSKGRFAFASVTTFHLVRPPEKTNASLVKSNSNQTKALHTFGRPNRLELLPRASGPRCDRQSGTRPPHGGASPGDPFSGAIGRGGLRWGGAVDG